MTNKLTNLNTVNIAHSQLAINLRNHFTTNQLSGVKSLLVTNLLTVEANIGESQFRHELPNISTPAMELGDDIASDHNVFM